MPIMLLETFIAAFTTSPWPNDQDLLRICCLGRLNITHNTGFLIAGTNVGHNSRSSSDDEMQQELLLSMAPSTSLGAVRHLLAAPALKPVRASVQTLVAVPWPWPQVKPRQWQADVVSGLGPDDVVDEAGSAGDGSQLEPEDSTEQAAHMLAQRNLALRAVQVRILIPQR